MNRFSICLDKGLSPIQHQAIILTNAWLFFIGPLGTNLIEILIKTLNFIHKNASIIIICEKVAILSRGGGGGGGELRIVGSGNGLLPI